MIRRPPRSTQSRSSAASDVYKRQPRRPEVALAVLLHGRLWSASLHHEVIGAARGVSRYLWQILGGQLAYVRRVRPFRSVVELDSRVYSPEICLPRRIIRGLLGLLDKTTLGSRLGPGRLAAAAR